MSFAITPDPIGLLALLWLLFKGNRQGQQQPAGPRPQLPTSPPELVTTPEPAPWPQALPSGLPTFPGSGWEYDEPPPRAVQQRAGQLVSQLWAKGSGASKIELTGGRWIAYRAEVVRSGKKGVVAYRPKKNAAPAAAPKKPPATATPAPAPAPEPAIPVSTEPAAPAEYVDVQNGLTYRWKMGLVGFDDPVAVGMALEKLDAWDITVRREGPYLVAVYNLQALASKRIQLRVATGFPIEGKMYTATFFSIEQVLPRGVPASAPAPGAAAAPGPTLLLRDLKMGDGLSPAAPLEEVKVVQRRLQVTPVDGRFGVGTRDAVIKFQVQTGLAPNLPLDQLRKRGFGAVKKATWEKLFAVRA